MSECLGFLSGRLRESGIMFTGRVLLTTLSYDKEDRINWHLPGVPNNRVENLEIVREYFMGNLRNSSTIWNVLKIGS